MNNLLSCFVFKIYLFCILCSLSMYIYTPEKASDLTTIGCGHCMVAVNWIQDVWEGSQCSQPPSHSSSSLSSGFNCHLGDSSMWHSLLPCLFVFVLPGFLFSSGLLGKIGEKWFIFMLDRSICFYLVPYFCWSLCLGVLLFLLCCYLYLLLTLTWASVVLPLQRVNSSKI